MFERIRKSREEGFTLIELLIVVIILGILAAVVLFGVGAFSDDAKLKACKTDLKNVATAEAAYFAKTGDWPGSEGALTGTPQYLKSWPADDNYTINLGTDGNPTATGISNCTL